MPVSPHPHPTLDRSMTERTPPSEPGAPIDATLWAAYRATHYVVDAPDGEVVLHVGAANDALAALMRVVHAPTAAVLTAYNPWSVATPAHANDAAQRELEAALAAHGIAMLPASGRDPSGAWPPEASVLAFGLTRDAAHALARRFAQNAFVWVAAPGRACELVPTRAVAGDPGVQRRGVRIGETPVAAPMLAFARAVGEDPPSHA